MKVNSKIAKQIYKSLDDYDLNDLFDKEKYNNLNKIRKDFIKKFSKDFILNKMTLKQYVEADGNQKNFCYIIERKLRGWGSILGATNKKFGIYKKGKKYKATLVWDKNGKANKGFVNLKIALYDLLEAGKKKDYDAIENSKISPMFKSIILSLYYEKDYIAINKPEDADLFLRYLKIDYDKDEYNTFEKKKRLLIAEKKKLKEFHNKSNYFFMRFLYKYVKGAAVSIVGNTKMIDINAKNINIVDWDYLNNHKAKNTNKNNSAKRDYEKENKNRMLIGSSGEDAILKYEKEKLKEAGRADLAKKVRRVSNDNDSLGYDIKSFDKKGKEIHIEVKTKNSKKEMLDFYITNNELNVSKNDKKHLIYYLFDIASKSPKLHIVDKKQFKDKYLKPVLYKVNIDVKRKNLKSV